MGMLVGSLVVSHISSQWATWAAMIALLAIHLGTNYLAVRAVSMRTLNRQRANLVFSTYLENSSLQEKEDSKCFPTPEQISVQERIFERDGVLRWKGGKILGHCEIGVPLRRILDLFERPHRATGSYTGPQSLNAARLLDEFQNEEYILWYDEPQKTVLIVLKASSNTKTQLYAWLHALYLAKAIDIGRKDTPIMESVVQTRSELELFRESFLKGLQKVGWDIETGALETKSGTRIKDESENLRDEKQIR